MKLILNRSKLLLLALSLFGSSFAVAQALPFDTNLTYFKRKADIKVKNCYSSGWCKIENNNYVKRFDIEKKPGRLFKIRDFKSEVYERNSKLKKDKKLWKYVSKRAKKSKKYKKNYKFGYSPASLVKRYYALNGRRSKYKKPISYKKDDLILIKKHYRSGWSRLDNGSYIKRREITGVPFSLYKVRSKIAYVYIKNKFFKKNKDMYKYAKDYSYKKAVTKKDFNRGYTRVYVIKSYLRGKEWFVDGLILMGSVGTSMGTATTDIDKNLWADDDLDAPAGTAIDLGVGVVLNKNLTATGNIQMTTWGKAKLTNAYLGINYITSGTGMRYKVGALAGVSMLTWSESPLNNTVEEDKNLKQDSLLYGVQAGVLYGVADNFDITLKAQLLLMDQILKHNATDANPDGDGTLKHTMQTNIMLGVRYKFGVVPE